MPIYEYQCQQCGSTFEAMQSVSAKPLKTCQIDDCNGKVQRLMSASGFILRGSGWYSNDYPSESRKQGWESEQKQASGQSADTPGKSESAPASQEAAPAKAATDKPAAAKPAKKPSQKNPYSGGSRKKVKSAK